MQIIVWIGAFVSPLLIGLAAGAGAIRAARRTGRRIPSAAIGAAAAFGLAYAVSVIAWVEVGLSLAMVYAPMDAGSLYFHYDSQSNLTPDSQAHVAAARTEFWFRNGTGAGRTCHTGPDGCKWANIISQNWSYCSPADGRLGCDGVGRYAASGLAAAAIAAGISLWTTRRRKAAEVGSGSG